MIDIPGYEGRYKINESGEVFSAPKPHRNWWKKLTGDIVQGYRRVNLFDSTKRSKRFFVHRLMGFTFFKNPMNKPNVNHIDGNRLNNNISNLEWCTAKENHQHSIKMGWCVVTDRMRECARIQGIKNRKVKEDVVKEIRFLHSNKTHTQKGLAKKFNISTQTVNRIVKNKSYFQ